MSRPSPTDAQLEITLHTLMQLNLAAGLDSISGDILYCAYKLVRAQLNKSLAKAMTEVYHVSHASSEC